MGNGGVGDKRFRRSDARTSPLGALFARLEALGFAGSCPLAPPSITSTSEAQAGRPCHGALAYFFRASYRT